MQGGEKDCAQGWGTRAAAASSRDGAGEGTEREGGMVLPPPHTLDNPARGGAPLGPPTPPDHPGRAWPGRLGPAHRPYLRRPPRTARPRRVGGEEAGAGPARPSNFLQVHSRASPFRLPDPGLRRPVPARPLPPGYIRSRRSRPRPGLQGGAARALGTGGGAARAMCRASGLDGQRAGGGAARTVSLPVPARAPPPVPGPTDGGGGSGPGAPGPPRTPGPRPRSPSSEGQSVRRPLPGLRQLVPSSGVRSESYACSPLPSSSGLAPPGKPALCALPAAVGAAAAPYV